MSFRYPPEWLPVRGAAQDRYEGESGFFSVSAGGTGEITLEEMTENEAKHILKPYGSKPDIQGLSIDNQTARLILPSDDQAASMRGQAAFIAKYPEPVEINGKTYKYFILYADKSHINYILSLLSFIRKEQ